MKNENYIVIQGWMVNELDLKPTELILYAVIYGFSQDGDSKFEGSLKYLQEVTGTSKNTVKSSLKNLCDKGLVDFDEYEFKGNTYKRYSHIDRGGQNLTPGVSEIDQGGSSIDRGVSEIDPNNIVNTIENKNSSINSQEILKISRERIISEVHGVERQYYNIAKSFVELFKKNVEEKGGIAAKVSRLKYGSEVKSIRLAMERDGITQEQFRQIFEYLRSPDGEFWHANILSCYKLRKQAQTLLMQSKRSNGKITAETKTAAATEALRIIAERKHGGIHHTADGDNHATVH